MPPGMSLGADLRLRTHCDGHSVGLSAKGIELGYERQGLLTCLSCILTAQSLQALEGLEILVLGGSD
jgi:hypothetical protein